MTNVALDGADCSWPSAEELGKLQEIREKCAAELAALSESPRDVVGDIRVARFLRFYGGKVPEAAKGYSEFLKWRVQEKIDTLRKGIIDLKPDQFQDWVDSVRSPFAPVLVPIFGQHKDGHLVIFASPGYFKASEFVKQRPACHTMDNDIQLMRIGVEYMMKLLDDYSYERHQMLYAIKVVDMMHLGRETLPIFVPEIRKFAQDNGKQIMDMYCDQDILILMVNAPFVVRFILAFATTFMAKRQSNRIKVFSSATSADAQKMLRAIGPPSMFPASLQGTRRNETIPFYLPLAQDDPARIKAWMARTTSGITRAGASSPPVPRETDEKISVVNTDLLPEAKLEEAVTPNAEELPVPGRANSVLEEVKPSIELEESPASQSGWFCCAA